MPPETAKGGSQTAGGMEEDQGHTGENYGPWMLVQRKSRQPGEDNGRKQQLWHESRGIRAEVSNYGGRKAGSEKVYKQMQIPRNQGQVISLRAHTDTTIGARPATGMEIDANRFNVLDSVMSGDYGENHVSAEKGELKNREEKSISAQGTISTYDVSRHRECTTNLKSRKSSGNGGSLKPVKVGPKPKVGKKVGHRANNILLKDHLKMAFGPLQNPSGGSNSYVPGPSSSTASDLNQLPTMRSGKNSQVMVSADGANGLARDIMRVEEEMQAPVVDMRRVGEHPQDPPEELRLRSLRCKQGGRAVEVFSGKEDELRVKQEAVLLGTQVRNSPKKSMGDSVILELTGDGYCANAQKLA